MRITKVRNVTTPNRGTERSAGIDFYIPDDFSPIMLLPHFDVLIPSGIVAEVPKGYMLMGADKSGIAVSANGFSRLSVGACKRKPLESSLVVGAKIIDEDYQGEIGIHVINVGNEAVHLMPGMKISQFILVPVLYDDIEVVESREELFSEKTARGPKGFGSSGE